MNKQIKGLLAGLATVAVIGTAIAQGTPPNPAKANPATGAGQQSSQGTPMGTTGVQGGNSQSTMGTTAAAPAPAAAPMTSSTTTTEPAVTTASNTRTRAVRADRN